MESGRYRVIDGNSTLQALKELQEITAIVKIKKRHRGGTWSRNNGSVEGSFPGRPGTPQYQPLSIHTSAEHPGWSGKRKTTGNTLQNTDIHPNITFRRLVYDFHQGMRSQAADRSRPPQKRFLHKRCPESLYTGPLQ
jgi:hypothetical protein